MCYYQRSAYAGAAERAGRPSYCQQEHRVAEERRGAATSF